MLLPHDVFTDMIKHADMKTLWQLSRTDKTIKQLCLNDPFGKVLLEFSRNPYFNLDIKSTRLDDFLNDLVGHDMEMLKRLQTSFGACLIGKLFNKQIIVLDGDSNGKSTFLTLMNRVLQHRFVNGTLTASTKYYKDAYIVRFIEGEDWTNFNFVSTLKRLSGGDVIYARHDIFEHQFTIVIDQNRANLLTSQTDQAFNKRLNVFHFKTRYVHNPAFINVHDKSKIPNMIDLLLSDENVLPALLNFLLEGCREIM